MTDNIQTPKITVLMPSLNVAKYIRQSVDSVCKQSFSDLEIICIDAGSTDGTLDILEEIQHNDQRVRIVHSDKKSYGYQMNLGMKKARGEFIGIVETDDFIDAQMYERLYNTAMIMDADVVKANYYNFQCGHDYFCEELRGLPYDKVINPCDHILLFTRRPSIWSGLYRKTFLERNGIDFLETPGASYQDTSFILKIWISAKRVCLIKNAFLHYRLDNPNSSIQSKGKEYCVCDEFNAVHEYLKLRPEKKDMCQNIIMDQEATMYEWNYRRIDDRYKVSFLNYIQQRLQSGLEQKCYERRYLRWRVWRMIIEVAIDPMIYLYCRSDKNYRNELTQDKQVDIEKKKEYKKWAIREKVMAIPETIKDMLTILREFGLKYCVKRIYQVLRRKINL